MLNSTDKTGDVNPNHATPPATAAAAAGAIQRFTRSNSVRTTRQLQNSRLTYSTACRHPSLNCDTTTINQAQPDHHAYPLLPAAAAIALHTGLCCGQ
jgi:hypothetical protein